MEKRFTLSINPEHGPGLRAEIVFSKASGRTVITAGMSVPNQVGHLTLLQAQAEVLRMAIADLTEERDALLRTQDAGTSTS